MLSNDFTIKKIKFLILNGQLRWTNHVLIRIIQRGISTDDITNALINGEIIESYPSDYPYPSYLVLGISLKNKYIHIVCGIADTELWLITAYYPDLSKWNHDLKTRKE